MSRTDHAEVLGWATFLSPCAFKYMAQSRLIGYNHDPGESQPARQSLFQPRNQRRGEEMRGPTRVFAVCSACLALMLTTDFSQAGENGPRSGPALANGVVQAQSGEEVTNTVSDGRDAGHGCTIIYASDETTALAGSNEDWTSHFNDIWFLPADEGKFGRVYFGVNFDGERIPQGGMNDHGLFYDGASAETVTRPPRDPTLMPPVEDLHLKALEECSTVDEVVSLYERHHMSVGDGQLMFGDRFGNSVIMEATGSIISKQGQYQVATNFFQSMMRPEDITDTRYRMATELFEQSDDISVDLFRRILNATHWEEYSGSMTVTLYSYICDLRNGDIYIYHFHDFDDVVKINLRDELAKGERYLSILSLFPYETYAAQRHKAQWTLTLLTERAREKGVEGDEGVIALCKRIRRGEFEDYELPLWEGHLNALGYELLENDRVEDAILTFAYTVSEYPESANACDSLAEAYMRNGETGKAIEQYEKSLELDPANDNARDMLKKIAGE